MALETAHPALAEEQGYVDGAYACLESMLEEVRGLRFRGVDELERQAFEQWRRVRVAALSDTSSALVFGRIDDRQGEAHYIGRHHVRDDRYNTVVVDWRAPVATTFYRASAHDPMGLWRRRRFLVDRREVLGITDEDLAGGVDAADARADEILQHELERQRGGRMRDIVATIHAEQDVAIRAPLKGVIVVQGGPGTGKTAIGLHRAAYLLYEHRRHLERRGVLVVGPNPVFIRYISQVLPSLGEAAVTQLPVDALASIGRRVPELHPEAARLKGDARMAEVVRRALGERFGRIGDDLELVVRGSRFTLRAEEINREAETLRSRGGPYRSGREALRDRLVGMCYTAYERSLPAGAQPEGFAAFTSALRREGSFRRLMDEVWPSVTPERLVTDLYASPGRLSRACEGLFRPAERRHLRRSRPETRRGWTAADGPVVDEARTLVDGPPERYGHAVVDEAQGLSPMQLRMIARRCHEGSATVLGDLGQATGIWAHDEWEEILRHFPGSQTAQVTELTLGYRVCPAVMEVATGILREAAVGVRPPVSVRRERGEVVARRMAEGERAGAVVAAAQQLRAELGAAAIIAPAAAVEEVRSALREAGEPYAEADRDLTEPITVVPVERAKGLEFEGVVLAEPAAIVEEGGLRLLYVAVTRAMRNVIVVHAGELPSSMADAQRDAPGTPRAQARSG